jgi:lysozyme
MISKIFKNLVRFEGYSAKPYRCTAGKLSIGYGRNLDDVGIIEKEAEILLFFDVFQVSIQLDSRIPYWKDQPIPVRIALVEMAFQMGVGGLLTFKKMLSAVREKRYHDVITEMLDSRWARQTPLRATHLSTTIREMLENPLSETRQKKEKKAWDEEMSVMYQFHDILQGMTLYD